jgi:hypothetical protein
MWSLKKSSIAIPAVREVETGRLQLEAKLAKVS